MATVILNEEALSCTYKRYPANCQKLNKIKQQGSVFVIAKVVRLFEGNQSLEENVEEGKHVFPIVELLDETGKGFLLLNSENELDSIAEKQAKNNTLAFFNGQIGKYVYLLNAKVNKYPKRTLALN